jgi:hypothetical protein
VPAAEPRVVHFSYDTLPRVVPAPGTTALELRVPFRIDTDPGAGLRVISWRLEADVDGEPWTVPSGAHRVTESLCRLLQRRMQRQGQFRFDRVPPYLDMLDRMRPGVEYLEGAIPGVEPGRCVGYRLEVTLRHGQDEPIVVRSRGYSCYAVNPDLGREDIRRIHIPAPGGALRAFALYHRREGGFDHLRVDVVSLEADPESGGPQPELVDLVVTAGDRTVALTDPQLPVLPLVSTATDAVTISIPVDDDDPELDAVTVAYRGAPAVSVDPRATDGVGAARVMFVNFAIQGLNDYFGTADSDYTPPRTYTQVTMRDEDASFSSRPGSREDSTGDGYEFTLDAHRFYGIAQLWVMNGGLLTLLAHDCPEALARMRADVDAGLLTPVVAGFGAHRLPYYTAATNRDAITAGADAMRALLGRYAPVYYPDSRLVTDRDNVTSALREAGMEYVVVDAGEHEDAVGEVGTVIAHPEPPLGVTTAGRWHSWQYLWRDRRTGIKILFIDPEMKDGLFGASPREADRGKISLNLRRKFIELAAQPQLRRDNLLVYSDDADKASGNGWFDGVYDNQAVQYNRLYQAALCWIRAHPWVRAVTTDDLTDADCVGELDLISASDPYIARNWRLPGVQPDPRHDYGLAFDTWYAAWSTVEVGWLGETLGEISDRAERAVAARPRRTECDELARLYLGMCLHESQWSKFARGAGTEAEDFVVAESIQLRNTHVYLAAGIWADWAAEQDAPAAFRDSGPVVERVARLDATVDAAGMPPWRRPEHPGLQWDHDPLPNVILYNTEALVVIDRNGGRITHLFSRVDGRPVSVSGTFKAYQFLDLDWDSDAGVKSDGIVLQNTVYTPNHAYVACDVVASRGTIGAGPPDDTIFDWYYPDNFNAYRVAPESGGTGGDPSVTLLYADGAPPSETPDTLQDLHARLVADREAKVAGAEGLVLHDVATFGRFSKTIRLTGKRVHVAYTGTRPGHVVTNEFCVDLYAATMRGVRQERVVAADRRTVRLAGGPLGLDLTVGAGCAFSAASLASLDPPDAAALRLRRVLTDTLEVVAPDGGAFDYMITLP